MSEHTQGPWEVDPEDGCIYARKDGCRMAAPGRRNSIDEERANARLIASAPDLHAALIKMLDCYWGKGDGEPAPEFIQKAADLCGYKLDQ